MLAQANIGLKLIKGEYKVRYQRITKSIAKKLWKEGQTIYLCPSNCRPGGPWSVECPVKLSDDLKSDAARYKDHFEDKDSYYSRQYADLWKGSIELTAWHLMYNNWSYYNTNSEMGYYAHYYVKIE